MTLAGESIVFNTPNDQSRPGYLKMGWSVARRLPIGVLPAGPRSLRAMVSSRVPAEMWSQPTSVGLDAGSALADESFAAALLQHAPQRGFRTDRTPEYLAWRTSWPHWPTACFWRRTVIRPREVSSSACAGAGMPLRLRSSSSSSRTAGPGRC